MKFNLNRKGVTCLLAALFTSLAACQSDSKSTTKSDPAPEVPPETSIEIFLSNFEKAMDERDKDLFEQLLDEGFLYSTSDCLGQLLFASDRETMLQCMTGSRDGSREGIWDIFRDYNFDYALIQRSVALGPESPAAFEGDPDGHPEEDWDILTLQVNMLMTDGQDNGFRVDQGMIFKLRRNEAGLLRLIRWESDPLTTGECSGGGKILSQNPSTCL